MKRVLYCLFPIFMMLGAVSAEAQTTDGKEFWLTFGKNWRTNQNDGVLELQIRIVSRNLPASGTIHFTELGTTKTFNLGAWDVFNYSLSPTEISAVYNGVQGTNNKSIHIKSNDNAVTAYALNQYRLSADATNLLPVTAYDYEYYHISYIPRSSDENDAYAVIAIENGTQVYHNNGSTPVATLNAGQVYYRTSATDMTGARVVADKPVAFFALNQGVFIPIGLTGASADVLMQQLAPVNTWGKRFFVPVSNVAVNTKERVRIVASQDGTTFVTPPTGVLVITGTGGQPNLANPLNAGQFFELEIYLANSGCYFEMDKPVGVCTYLTSAAYNNGGTNPHSDPSQAWLPAIEQSANDALITPFLPTGITELKDHFALIMTSTDAQNDTEVSIGGATPVGLTGGTWHDNAAAGMSFYSMPLDGNTSTSYRFINDAGIIVMGYGYGWAESYYYLGYSSMRNLAAAFFANDVHYQDWGNTLFCVHDITITADIEEINDNAGSLQWYIDGVLQPDLEDQDVWTENFPAGEYEIKMWVLFADGTSNNFISILRVGANIETDVSPLPGGSVIGDGCYEVGEEVELTAIPNAPTYKFSHWTKGDDPTPISEDNPYKFPAAESELWIAHFVWDIFPVTLIAKPQANNEVKGAGFYAHGEEATIEAIADACHTFINWTAFDEFGNEVEISTNPIEYITVLSDTTLTANFSQNIHEITLHADPDVGGTVQGEEIDIPCGELRTITATPDDCYTFKHWEDPNGNIISTKAIFTFPVMSDTILTAIFEIKMFNVILVAIPDDVGIVEGAGVYKCGDVVTINAYSEDDCYKFVKWTENGVLFSENAEETITVMGHRVLIAHFEKLIYMITAEPYPTEGGEVKGDGSYFCELTASLEAKPTEGWDFIDWTENGLTVETEAVYSFPATGDRHLVANFVQRSYDITVLAEPITGGVALLSGTHPHGMILTVNAIAFIPCNKFKYWTRDGEIISYNPDYTFTVVGPDTLIAHFELLDFNIEVYADPPWGGEAFGGGTFPCDTGIQVYAVAAECWQFVGWTENDDTVFDLPYYSFPVKGTRILTAHFKERDYQLTVGVNPNPLGGTATILTDGAPIFPCETAVTVLAEANEGYKFVNWTKNGVTVVAPEEYTFAIMEDCVLIANFELKDYYISVSAKPEQGGDVFGGGYYKYNDPADVYTIPNSGYKFIEWTENDISIGTTLALPQFSVTQSRTLVANYEKKQFEIIVEASGGGTACCSNFYDYGELVEIEAVPADCYKFVNWTENGVEVATTLIYNFVATKDRKLVANFIPAKMNIILLKEPSAGGDVSYNFGNGTYDCGDEIIVLATPNEGYEFLHWTENGNPDPVCYTKPYEFEVKGHRVLTAHFSKKEYEIIVFASSDNGTACCSGFYLYGEIITITAEANPCYEFVDWTDGITGAWVSDAADYPFKVTEDRIFAANFTQSNYEIKVSAEPSIGGKAYGADTDVDCGDERMVWAIPTDDTWVFVEWTEDDVHASFDSIYHITVTKSHDLVAHFARQNHDIILIADPPTGGDVFGNDILGGGAYPYDSEVDIKAVPATGHKFMEWRENGILTSDVPDFTLKVDGPHTFTATFERIDYEIILYADPPYAGEVFGDGIFPYGTPITIKATPNATYSFLYWTDTQGNTIYEAEHTFTVEGDRTLTAHFDVETYQIVLLANPTDGGDPVGGGTYAHGDPVKIFANPSSQYTFVNWTENGVPVALNADDEFIATQSRTLVANFEKKFFEVIADVNHPGYGETTGSGSYEAGTIATVEAYSNDCYRFEKWTIDGDFVSDENPYSFVVEEDVTIIAHFYALEFDTYCPTLWNNTFMLDLKKLKDDGYDVIGCKWYKNGIEQFITNTIDEFSYSAGPYATDQLEPAPTYYSYRLITSNHGDLCSTIKLIDSDKMPPVPGDKIWAHPNPVMSGAPFTVEGVAKNDEVRVYNQSGICVHTAIATGETITLTLHVQAGVYVVRANEKQVKVVIIR